jgi:hypothetical protein
MTSTMSDSQSKPPVVEPEQDAAQKKQQSADKTAADRREAATKAASSALAEQRAAEDEATKERRMQEDDATATARREADRQVASARSRLVTAAEALQVACDAEPSDLSEIRVANAEMQAAVAEHLSVHPE